MKSFLALSSWCSPSSWKTFFRQLWVIFILYCCKKWVKVDSHIARVLFSQSSFKTTQAIPVLKNYRHDFALKKFQKFKILVCQKWLKISQKKHLQELKNKEAQETFLVFQTRFCIKMPFSKKNKSHQMCPTMQTFLLFLKIQSHYVVA